MQELASGAGEDVVFAMNTFIKRLLGTSDPENMKVWKQCATISRTFAERTLSFCCLIERLHDTAL